MNGAERIDMLRKHVAQAEAQVAELKAARVAKEAKIAALEVREVLYQVGDPVVEGTGITKVPQLQSAGSAAAISAAYRELGDIQAAHKEADSRASALQRALLQTEHDSQTALLAQCARELQVLVDQDDALCAEVETQVLALRAAMARWNANVDAKIALRRQFIERRVTCPDVGALGRADARWNAWFTADFADDAALSRQFRLMVRGQGYMNRLPSAEMRALASLRHQLPPFDTPASRPLPASGAPY